MHKTLTAITIALVATPGLAQIDSTFTTVGPCDAQAASSVWPSVQQQVAPAGGTGPLHLQPSAFYSQATNTHGLLANGTTWQLRAECYEAAPSFASAAGDVVLHLFAPSPVQVSIEVSSILALTAGSAAPSFRVDVGDDGNPEMSELAPGPFAFTVQLGPTPLAIRMRAAVAQIGNGIVDLSLVVNVAPATAFINTIPIGCSPVVLHALPTYVGNGVEFHANGPDPVVLVLGLSFQPQFVPSTFPGLCLLLPSTDLLVPLGVAPPYHFTLPLPAAVRPITLWAQGVVVAPTGLGTTNGSTITAL